MTAREIIMLDWGKLEDWSELPSNGRSVSRSEFTSFIDRITWDIAKKLDVPYKTFVDVFTDANQGFYTLFSEYYYYLDDGISLTSNEFKNLKAALRVPLCFNKK